MYCLGLYFFCQFLSVFGNPTFSVQPSSSILVNSSVNLTCLFTSGQGGVTFKFPNDVICSSGYIEENNCQLCGKRQTICPNNRSFTITRYVSPSWNGQHLTCRAFGPNPSPEGQSAIFSVKVPVADIKLVASHDVLDKDQSMTLTCNTNNCNPRAIITWYKGSQRITSGMTNSYTLDSNGLEMTTSILEYIGLVEDNGLQVYCTASNLPNNTVVSSNTIIDVKYAPSTGPILTAASSLLVDEGQTFTLRCSVSTLSDPPIRWSWVCGDDDLSATSSNLTRSTLSLSANRKYNQRTCHCLATSPRVSLTYNRTSEEKKITVYYKPSTDPILTNLSSLLVDEGQTITLRCSLSTLSNPPIKWSWVCGDDDLSGGATNSNLTQSTLTLSANRKYNQRTCHCLATSPQLSLSYNKISEEKDITVYYKPSTDPILTALSSLLVDEGHTFTLRCSVSTLSNPPIKWSWVCGDDDLSARATSSNLTQSTLTLSANRKYNQRTCHCLATSPKLSLSYNRTSEEKNITVYYNNIITSNFEQSYEINESQSFQLECSVDGNPLSNITWIFARNNSVLKTEENKTISLLHINNANCLDYGEYMVVAENGKGPASSSKTKITVKCKPRQYPADSTTDKLGVGNNQSIHISTRILLYPSSDFVQWNLTRKINESIIISNKSIGYQIKISRGETEENITLSKENVATEDFGNYTVIVRNTIGVFEKKYQVISARSPLPPLNLTLVCDNPFSITLTWIANFNGGDQQIFHIFSSSGEKNSSFKELTAVDDMGFGQIHIYSPAVDLYGQLWFKIAASNKFGNSTTGAIPCFTNTPDESPSNIAMFAGIAAGGGVCLAFVVIVVVVYFRNYHQYEKSAKRIERLNNVNENEDGADGDGLKENSLYVSAGPRDDEKPEVAVYAAVAKKLPQSDTNSNLYADVKKSGQDTNKGTMSSEVKPKKGLFKKDEKARHKKGKKPKNRLGEADVYENSEDIAMSRNVDNVYSNAGQKGLNKQEERGYKNKDGLLYVEVNFDGKQGQDNPIIHGEDEKTDYATVEFPMPSALHKASGSGEL